MWYQNTKVGLQTENQQSVRVVSWLFIKLLTKTQYLMLGPKKNVCLLLKAKYKIGCVGMFTQKIVHLSSENYD